VKKICFVCNDAAVEADTVFEGKDVHSWHLSEFERTAMSSRAIEREETKMGAKIEIDIEKLKALHAQGASDTTIAEQFGCSAVTIGARRNALGLPATGVGGWKAHKDNGSHPVRKVQRKTAIVKATPKPAVILSEAKDLALPAGTSGNGHTRCRVAMFEVEESDASVMAAIDAMKVAFARAA